MELVRSPLFSRSSGRQTFQTFQDLPHDGPSRLTTQSTQILGSRCLAAEFCDNPDWQTNGQSHAHTFELTVHAGYGSRAKHGTGTVERPEVDILHTTHRRSYIYICKPLKLVAVLPIHYLLTQILVCLISQFVLTHGKGLCRILFNSLFLSSHLVITHSA